MTMKKTLTRTALTLVTIIGLTGVSLAGCNKADPVAESQAQSIENSADSVRASGAVAANTIEASGQNTNDVMGAAGAATEETTEKLAGSVRDARNSQANEIDKTADAVRDAAKK